MSVNNKSIYCRWKKLENEAIELFSSIQPLPNAINKMFSFKHLKTAIGEHLESGNSNYLKLKYIKYAYTRLLP